MSINYKPIAPNILIKKPEPPTASNGIILLAPIAQKSYDCTVADVYERCEIKPGQKVIVPAGHFRPVPGSAVFGLLDIEEGMFVLMNDGKMSVI